jgi:Cu-processing system permease protein
VTAIVLYGFRESLRRKMFLVVLVLTAVFLGLYGYGVDAAFKDAESFAGPGQESLDPKALAGATVFGLALFAIMFLGGVLAVFLTLNVVRGDAEAGLLQPLVVRPIGRAQLLFARFLGAALACAVYVLLVYFAALGITDWAGSWLPDRIVTPGLEVAGGVVIIAAIALAGSVVLSPIANGIGTLMIFGAGFVSGLLGEIGHVIHSHTLQHISRIAWWILPFDALYEDALHRLTVDTSGFAAFVLKLGPFGGSAQAEGRLLTWAVAYLALVIAGALLAFSRRDL